MIFKDKTVIITGGSEGVGAATARLFAAAGANLMLVARGKKKLEAIAEELRDKTRVEIFAMDETPAWPRKAVWSRPLADASGSGAGRRTGLAPKISMTMW